jgi:MtaA/CmuA family methyltransferase
MGNHILIDGKGKEAVTGRERILALLAGEQTDSLSLMPVTMMLAAEQLGAPYRDYATDYRVLVDAQLITAETFDFDHVACVSDPAREAADCGATVVYYDDQPPAIDDKNARLADKAELLSLRVPDLDSGGRMHDRIQACALFEEKAGGEKFIEGWVEGPCAEAAVLRGINTIMTDFFYDPQFVHDLFTFAVEMELAFAKAQVRAGADIIGLGDAAASLVGPQLYEEFVFPYEKRLVDGIHEIGGRVRLHICGNTTPILDGMGRLGCDIVDIDSMVSLAAARAAMSPNQILLGNIDPVLVMKEATPDTIREVVATCHSQAGEPFIVGAGCEIPRNTPRENVDCLREYARAH